MIHVLLDIDLPEESEGKVTAEDIRRYFQETYVDSEVEIDDEGGSARLVLVDSVTVTQD